MMHRGTARSLIPQEAPEWAIPQELPERKFPVLPMTLEMLPVSLRAWVADITERMCVPLDFVAVSALVVIASLIGIKIAVLPKRNDERWLVVPNLYGMIVGPPGMLKSPTIAGNRASVAGARSGGQKDLRRQNGAARVR